MILQVENVSKIFPNMSLPALDRVSFNLDRGESIGIVGNSGSGKSTLGRIILKLVEPDVGNVFYEGHSIHSMTKDQLKLFRSDVQMIFQDPERSFNPSMTIYQSLIEPLKINKIKSYEFEKIIIETVQNVGIDWNSLHKFPSEFSGGQLQRLSIARALTVKPKLLIADEAVSALDVNVQSQILNLIHQLKKHYHLSLIFISHNLSVVEKVCDHLLVLYKGRVVEQGKLESLFQSPHHPFTANLINSQLSLPS